MSRRLLKFSGGSGDDYATRRGTQASCSASVARIEGGKVRPSTDALEHFAHATRTRLRIVFERQAAS